MAHFATVLDERFAIWRLSNTCEETHKHQKSFAPADPTKVNADACPFRFDRAGLNCRGFSVRSGKLTVATVAVLPTRIRSPEHFHALERSGFPSSNVVSTRRYEGMRRPE
jgi:hypothetical protein